MRLSVLQPPYPAEGSPSAASACLDWMISHLRALDGDQDLILLPEYATTPGIEDANTIRSYAMGEGKAFLAEVSQIANRLSTWVALGTVARDGDFWMNRAVVFGRDGGQWFAYDKVHLTEYESETLDLRAGDVVGHTQLNDVDFGIATCFDAYFSEYFAALSRRSVDLVFSPSYQRSESGDRLRYMSQARAIDCDSWLVRSSYAVEGKDRGGHSMIVAPDGEIVVDAGNEPGVIRATIDPKRKFVKPRSHGQSDSEHGQLISEHRRPDVYSQI